MAYDPLADAIRENGGSPSGVTAALPSGYDPLAEAEKQQASPLKTAYQNGKPVVPDVPWATNPNDDAYGGRPGSQGMPLVSGVIRGVLDAADTGTNILGSVFSSKADADATRARLAADRDAWKKQYGDSTAAQIGRVGGQIASTAGPVGLIGKGIGAVSQGLPAALRLLTQGAAQGGAQAGMTASGYDESTGEQVAKGAITGGVVGPVTGGLTKGLDAARGYIGGVRPDVAELANTGRRFGYTPPVTALTANPHLKQALDTLQKLPFTGGDAAALAKQRDWQRAVSGTMGSPSDTFNRADMTTTLNRIREGYNTALGQIPAIPLGPDLTTALSTEGARATAALDSTTVGHVGKAIRRVTDEFANGPINGQQFKSFVGKDGPMDDLLQGAPTAAQPYIRRIISATRQQMVDAAPPGVGDTLRTLDQQYRAMHTIRPLAAKAALGDIHPGGLTQQVLNQESRFDGPVSGKAFTGGGPLGELGDVGKQFLGHISDSGTPARTQAYDFVKNPLATILAATPGILAGRPAQMWLNSPRIAGRMIDTSLGGPRPDIGRAVPVTSLLGLDAQR